jgi:hypothetical protein
MTVNPTSAGDTYKCPKGYYCLAGTTSPVACLAGTYNANLGADAANDCIISPAGYYTLDASETVGIPCTAGYYCPAGTTGAAAVPCPVGTIRATTGAGVVGDCSTCPAGYYCGEATVTATICPQGSYCTAGSSVPLNCPAGTFGATVGLTSSASCQGCLPGMYCSQQGLQSPDGLCDIGYFCIQNAITPNPTDGTTGNE